MKKVVKKSGRMPARETLTEAYEVRAFRDEFEEPRSLISMAYPPILFFESIFFAQTSVEVPFA